MRRRGWVHNPPGEGQSPGDGQPPKPDGDGYFYKVEAGNTKNDDDLYTWWCNLHGEIIAKAELTWTFDDGFKATGPGKPFTKSVDPRENPDYYITHTYTSTGLKTVKLDVLWTGEVSLEGPPPQQIEPVEIPTQTGDVEVLESQPRLGGD